MIDYSQYGQALLLQQLIADEMPRILVDIGAHDGVCGSNSRALLEQGWRGLLVEPLPKVFERLKENSSKFANVSLVHAACSDRTGIASIRVGRDGALGQMSTFSQDPQVVANLSDQVIEVQTATLPSLLETHNIPDNFGVLLVDTEGWDLTVLQGLIHTHARPRIIVTEDLASTDQAKYGLLASLGYQNMGFWGSDSFWSYGAAKTGGGRFEPPVHQLPPSCQPSGNHAGTGRCMLDRSGFYRSSIAGWAWVQLDSPPPEDVFLVLKSVETGAERIFAAWRNPRPDVAEAFQSEALLFSGFRAYLNVEPGNYQVTVIQQGADYFTSACAGNVTLPH